MIHRTDFGHTQYRITAYINTAGPRQVPRYSSKDVSVASGTAAVADFIL